MKLYSGKIPGIAAELIRKLRDDGDIEVNDGSEAALDIEAVLKEYQRLDRELTEQAKDLMERRKLAYEQFGKIKRELGEKREFPSGDEVIGYLANQIIEAFMHSRFVDEVFAEDSDLRKKVSLVLRKHMAVDSEVDQEVRRRIKNIEEGTATWEIEYQRVMENVRHKHKLD
jgi:hypothetical protein